jgi:hypothetical protein
VAEVLSLIPRAARNDVGPNTAFTASVSSIAPAMRAAVMPAGAGRPLSAMTSTRVLESQGISAMPDHTREEMKAEVALAEARTDTKIARMEGAINTSLATIVAKIDNLSGQVAERGRDKNLIIGTIIVAAIALGGMLWGMASYGDALFGRGMSVRDVVQAVMKEQQAAQEKLQPPSVQTIPKPNSR